MEAVKPYKSKFSYSYALGAFPTYELLKFRPEWVLEVYVHSTYTDAEKLKGLCDGAGVKLCVNDKAIARLSDKENVYVIGVYEKKLLPIDKDKNHLMLVNPGNMGNVGTIIRTALAFGIHDIAIISPGVDVHNPKVVRGSMGAIFHMNISYFEDFKSYSDLYCQGRDADERRCFSFMLTANERLTADKAPKSKLFTLIFGNEAAGLPAEYAKWSTPVLIPQSDEVDSLNLTVAAGIGMYVFTCLKKD